MQEWIGEWIGKPLLTRGGERIGYIRSVQTDRALARVRNLECCDEEEGEFLLPVTAVERFGKDAAIVRAPAPPYKDCVSAPFGMAVYSREGELLGRIDDFGREGTRVTSLLLTGGLCVPVGQLVSAADAAIVDRTGEITRRPRILCRPAARARAADGEDGATEKTAAEKGPAADKALAAPSAAAPAAAGNKAAAGDKAAKKLRAERERELRDRRPRGRLAGSALLTGKTLPGDLLDARGNLLAPRGTVVDADVIRRALRHNKLFALTRLVCAQERP